MKKTHILLLLCMAMLLPSVASGQTIFDKQKVAIWDVRDMNDRGVLDGIKTVIRQSIQDLVTASEDYEVYEVNRDDIRRQLTASGKPDTFPNICKAIGSKADFIIFTDIKSSHSAIGRNAEDVTVFLTFTLYRIQTGTEVLVDMDKASSDRQDVIDTSYHLASRVLGVTLSSQTRPQTQQQPSKPTAHYSSNNQYTQSQSPAARGGVEVVLNYLKVFPNELGEFLSEPKTVIEQINKQTSNARLRHLAIAYCRRCCSAESLWLGREWYVYDKRLFG